MRKFCSEDISLSFNFSDIDWVTLIENMIHIDVLTQR